MITKASTQKIRRTMQDLPLPSGWARVFCTGCGQNELVQAGHEEQPHDRLKLHARTHQTDLAPELTFDGTDGLILTLTWSFSGDAP